MPFDGATLASVVHEISCLEGGRIDKIAQPEVDEIVLHIRAKGINHKLLLTANSNAPRLGFTFVAKAAPLTAPMFCMVLRKHLSGGRVVRICHPDFERIVEIHVDAMDEMGDRTEKILLVEIMSKHSNIMLVSNGKVLDAIKHVPFSVSMARPILPGAPYTRPPATRYNPLETAKDFAAFEKALFEKPAENTEKDGESLKISQSLVKSHNGISPILAAEICNRADIMPEKLTNTLANAETKRLYEAFCSVFSALESNTFECAIYKKPDGKPADLAVLSLSAYTHYEKKPFESPSAMLEEFYSSRADAYRVSQKTADMRKTINALLERCRKKAFVHEKSLADVENRDALRIKGELLTAYLYAVPSGAVAFTAENFYNENVPMEIPLDPTLTASENAQRYFKQYNKQKRAFSALQEQISKNADDLRYLESVAAAMETAQDEADIAEIRAELADAGFVKRRAPSKGKKMEKPAKPLKFTTADGFEIYVGKNNTQNDYLTLRFAKPSDIWFHTKDIAGSHVILVTGGRTPSDAAILEAASHAAKNSRAKDGSNVPVDYVARKHVKKPAGAKPGYVIYDYHKTVYVTP